MGTGKDMTAWGGHEAVGETRQIGGCRRLDALQVLVGAGASNHFSTARASKIGCGVPGDKGTTPRRLCCSQSLRFITRVGSGPRKPARHLMADAQEKHNG